MISSSSCSDIKAGETLIQETVEERQAEVVVDFRWTAIVVALDEPVQNVVPLFTVLSSQLFIQFLSDVINGFVPLHFCEKIVVV